jgi:VCBS repeat-containing protein
MSRLCQAVLLLFVLSQAYGQSNDPHATVVRIAGWTTTGERIGKIWVVVSSLDGREKYVGNGHDVELSVPTGEYMLQVEAPGFQSKRQILKAYQPAVFRSVALPVAWIHGQKASSLTGTVRNYEGDMRNLRVRLMGLYGSQLWESVLDAQGSFRFSADEGAYLLVVVADLEKGVAVIDSQPVWIPLGKQQTVTIDLKGKHGTPIPQPAP